MAKSIDKHINVWVNGKQVENNLKSIRSAIIQTTNELNKMTVGSDEYIEHSKKLTQLKSIYEEYRKELKLTSKELDIGNEKLNNRIVNMGALSSVYQTASGALRRFIGATQEYVDAYAAMDDAMSAVQKTTGMTREEVENLNSQLKNIDTRTSQEELLKIAEIGGRLGLAKGDIEAFTESVNVANVALGDSFGGGAEEIASVLGKIRGAFQETKDADIGQAFNSIGSALNSVGASCAATEGNVAQFAQRLGALPDAMKPTIQDAIGLGAAFENASINAEVAATAYGQLMTKAASNLEAFADAMGKPIEEVRELINTNPTEFMLQFAESFKGVPADQLGAKLKDLTLNAVGVQEAIGAMSGQTEKFREILSVSNQAFADGTSMMEEYSTVNNNAAAQLEKAKKKMQEMRVELGEKLIPVITGLYEKIVSGANFLSEHVALIKSIAVAIGLWVSTIALYKTIQTTANVLLTVSNALHKAHRIAVLEAAAAQALFSKNMTRAKAATVLMSKELPILTAKFKSLKSSISLIGKSLKTIMKLSPAAYIAGIAAAVIHINREANKGKRIVKEIDESSRKAFAKGREDIEMEKKKIDELRGIINNENESRERKLQAIKDLQQIIPEYVVELSEEGRVLKENKKAIDDYITGLENKLTVEIHESKLRELLAKREEIREKAAEARREYYSSKWKKIKYDILYDYNDFAANRFVRQLAPLDKEIEALEKKLDGFHKKMNPPTAVQEEENGKIEPKHNASDPEHCMCKDCVSRRKQEQQARTNEETAKWKNFQEKVRELREKSAKESLNEWEKIKEQTTSQYDELIKEAKKFGKKGAQIAQELEQEKWSSVAKEGEQYLEKQQEFFQRFSEETTKMLSETQADNGTPQSALVTAIAGSDEEWKNKIAIAQKNADNLQAILDKMSPNDKEWNEFAAAVAAAQDAVREAEIKMGEARIAITQKFIYEQEKSIKLREKEQQRTEELKSLSTEEERAAKQREWKIADMEEEYDVEIQLMEAALAAKKALNDGDDDSIKKIEDLIEHLKDLKANVASLADETTSKESKPQKTGNPFIDLLNGSITDPQERFQTAVAAIQDFANQAIDIYHQISDAQQQSAEAEFQKYTETQDAKARKLKEQLDSGLISQKYYDAQIEKMEKEREAKEKKMKHDQFERERKSSIIEVLIQGGIAVARAFADYGWPWGLIPAALATAQTAAQAAIIGSQVNPYARGGFITKKQLALMGEEGKEWVASNKLLEDDETAPIIAALEEYQRGNKKALEMIVPQKPNWKNLSQTAKNISSNFASNKTPIINNYYTNQTNSEELLNEIRKMNDFLSDPKNRQAYISFKLQEESKKNREFIKNAARI